MSDRPQAGTIEGFVAFWVKSQLASQDAASVQLREYKHFLRASQLPDTITAFCCHLVSAGELSPWQCQKLRNGQWKGFFLDQYELVDELGHDHNFGYYLARDRHSRAYVRLAVVPPARVQGSQIEYKVDGRFE